MKKFMEKGVNEIIVLKTKMGTKQLSCSHFHHMAALAAKQRQATVIMAGSPASARRLFQ